MRIKWAEAARANRRAIFDRIEAENPFAAADMDDLFQAKADALAAHPYMGRPGRIEGTRELVAHKRYLLIYRVSEEEETVHIVRVLHTSRLWPPKPDR